MTKANSPEKLGLVWRGNVSELQYYRPQKGEVLGEAKQPEESNLSPEDFKKSVKERRLVGIYGPPPEPKP